MRIHRPTTTTAQHLCRVNSVLTFTHMWTSPPWLQHRDLNLCHDLSHHLFQTCLIHNSAPHTAPHPTNARNFIVLVTPFSIVSPSSNHIELLSIVTRGFVTVPNRRRLDGDPPRPTTELNSTSFSSRALLVFSFAVSIQFHHQLLQLIFQLRYSDSGSLENFTSTFFTSPSSLVRSWSRAVWMRS